MKASSESGLWATVIFIRTVVFHRPSVSRILLRPGRSSPLLMGFTMRHVALLFVLLAVGGVHAQDFSALKVEDIAAGFPGGEGPVWSRDGFLIFSDYSRDRLYKYVPGQAPEVYREDSHGTNGNTLDAQGRLYSCEYKSRRVTRTDRSGRIEVIAERFEGKRFNAPNDIVVRRDGHVYFTDPLFTPLDQRDLDFYGIFHITPQGRIEAIARLQTP